MSMLSYLQNLLSSKAAKGALVLLVLIVAAGFFVYKPNTNQEVTGPTLPIVKVTTVSELAGTQELSLIGTVRAFTEANVTSEVSGRVTGVNVALGQTVQAGQIMVTLENASQRAAVLQAEGAYEAALSAAEQSGISVEAANTAVTNAKNGAVTTYRSSYTTANGIVLNNIDTFFSQPDKSTPGLKLDGQGNTAFLNTERVAFQTILNDWQQSANALSPESDLDSALAEAESYTERLIGMIDVFITLFNDQGTARQYSDAELQAFSATFNGLRSQLNASLTAIDSARNNITAAEENLRRAELGASGGVTSAADAQVKQALGSLRAAQANLAKTILRSPITGTANSVNVRVGDFVGAFETIAQVANNNALEIVTFVGENERNTIAVGDEMTIEGSYTGIVTQISPSVNEQTGKTEVRIATENTTIQNGDTVTVTVTKTVANDAVTTVVVPLSAVKFDQDNGSIFIVEDGRLVAVPVELGVVRGGSIEVLKGLSASQPFVLDARGLLAGTEVEIKN